MLNLWAQPLVYRDRAHLIDQFPESDIVIATYWTTAHQYLAELRRRYGVVAVYYIQDYEAWFYTDAEYELQRDVVRSYAAADHHIVKSQWLAGLVGRHGTTSHVIPLGLDLDVFYPRPRATAPRPRVISIAATGSEQRRRGFPETVEIFRRVHALRPDVELVFVGGGREMPALPFPFTHVEQAYDQNRIAALISSADVLVDASLWQGFGRPGLEAMACGTVPVLTNIGGLAEYARDDQNCLLVDPQDATASAAAVLRILGDRDLHARLRAQGIITASRFSHELEASRHLELYRRWMSDKSLNPPRPAAVAATPLRPPRQTA
jgi:glycosyltransferase involved in cell wall biosynthesis